MNVLHIVPHMGGGVGSVICSYLKYEHGIGINTHTVISLEEINVISLQKLKELEILFFEKAHSNLDLIIAEVDSADVVLVHWWNHPLLQDLLINNQLPPNRMLIWCHISGLHSPNVICEYILELPDEFIFTTPLSNFVPCIESYKNLKDISFDTIWSTCGYESIVESFSPPTLPSCDESKKIRIGYIGNLDQTKLNGGFFEILSKIEPSEVQITIIGPPTDFFLTMLKESKNHTIEYLGYVSDDEKFRQLNSFDIFYYPLARNHYGTCDQAIQEAMVFGVPVIAFNNPMESYMIKNGKTGLIARNSTEFAELLQKMIHNQEMRVRISSNAQYAAKELYSIRGMSNSWNLKFNNILNKEKKLKTPLSEIRGRRLTPSEVMVTSLGIYGGIFCEFLKATESEWKSKIELQISALTSSVNWTSSSKSSVHHYKKFFNDENIDSWSRLMR